MNKRHAIFFLTCIGVVYEITFSSISTQGLVDLIEYEFKGSINTGDSACVNALNKWVADNKITSDNALNDLFKESEDTLALSRDLSVAFTVLNSASLAFILCYEATKHIQWFSQHGGSKWRVGFLSFFFLVSLAATACLLYGVAELWDKTANKNISALLLDYLPITCGLTVADYESTFKIREFVTTLRVNWLLLAVLSLVSDVLLFNDVWESESEAGFDQSKSSASVEQA